MPIVSDDYWTLTCKMCGHYDEHFLLFCPGGDRCEGMDLPLVDGAKLETEHIHRACPGCGYAVTAPTKQQLLDEREPTLLP